MHSRLWEPALGVAGSLPPCVGVAIRVTPLAALQGPGTAVWGKGMPSQDAVSAWGTESFQNIPCVSLVSPWRCRSRRRCGTSPRSSTIGTRSGSVPSAAVTTSSRWWMTCPRATRASGTVCTAGRRCRLTRSWTPRPACPLCS